MAGLSAAGLVLTTMKASGDFTNINVGLPGLAYSSVAWGDYDNDGRLDILLVGTGISQVWRNLGDGTFTNVNVGLPGVSLGSAAWGDFDNDGRLDIVLAGTSVTGGLCQVWRNMGDGTFSDINAGLPAVRYSAVAWGDYDNDGKLDVLLSGLSAIGSICRIFRNAGDGVFTPVNAALPGAYSGSVAWGDFDNDGWLDILLTGVGMTELVNQVWRNLGNGMFANINAGLPGVGGGANPLPSSAVWGDYDNDGWLDILFTGAGTFGSAPTQLWRNLGNGTFVIIDSGLVPRLHGFVAWGDHDNDGLLDIYLSGENRSGNRFVVWKNLGDGIFADGGSGIPPHGLGSSAWGDFDNDGRLDLLLSGVGHDDLPVSQVWRNIGLISNTAPASASGLAAAVSGNGVVLNWNTATDAQTPASGLSYNVRVGTAPGGSDVVSPHADSVTGFRRVPKPGNAQQRLSFTLTNLASGYYYWSVQAVDSAFAGGPFSAENSFIIGAVILQDGSFGMSNGRFGFNLDWQTGKEAMVEASTNLSDWVPIWTSPQGNGPVYFSDPATSTHGSRFYRALVR